MRSLIRHCALPTTLVGLAIAIAVIGCGDPPSVDGDGPTDLAPRKTTKKAPVDTGGEDGDDEGSGDELGDDVPSGTSSSSSSSGSSGKPPKEKPPPQDGGGTTPATGPCAGEATKTACFTCCETKNPAGLQVLQQAFAACACSATAPGNCVAQCGETWCQGFAPTAACDNCLNVANACEQSADTTCAQDATCNVMLTCDTSSSCSTKP